MYIHLLNTINPNKVMKKYFTLFSVLAMFFVGIQMSNAQERSTTQTPEVIAKTKTHQMHELVNLTGEQQSSIFKLLVDSETNLAALNSNSFYIILSLILLVPLAPYLKFNKESSDFSVLFFQFFTDICAKNPRIDRNRTKIYYYA